MKNFWVLLGLSWIVVAQQEFYLITSYTTGDCSGVPEPYFAAYKSGACLAFNTTHVTLTCESSDQLVEQVYSTTDATCSNPLAKVSVPLGCSATETNQSAASTCGTITAKNLVVFAGQYFSEEECNANGVPDFMTFIPEGACFSTGGYSAAYSCNPVSITTYGDGSCETAIFKTPLQSSLCSPAANSFISSSYCVSM